MTAATRLTGPAIPVPAGGQAATQPAPTRRLPLRWVGETLTWAVLGAIVFVIAIVPLIYTIDSAFYGETMFGLTEERSLNAIINVYTSSRYLGFLWEALVLAAAVTSLALTFGVVMAFLVARTDIRFKGAFDILVIMPLFLSPFTGLIAWIVLGSARTGFVNLAFAEVLKSVGLEPFPLVNIWSYWGVVWVMFLFFCPFAYLFTVNNLRSMDASLEEAARTAGATQAQAVMKITLPMMVPAIFAAGLLIFVLAAEIYTIPGIIGATAGFTTLPWQIYIDSTVAPMQRAHAAAAGTILLWVTVFGILLQRRITRVSERFVTIGGKGHKSKPIDLGRWRWVGYAILSGYVFCAVILPIAALVLFSFMKYSTINITADVLTLDQYARLFSIENTRQAIMNTLLLGVLAGGICVAIGALISYLEIRRPSWMGSTVAMLAILPIAVPGVVYGIGLLWTYLRTPLYGTIWILLLAYIAKYLPYAVVVSRTSIMQINRELEESARMSGANRATVLTRITMPLVKPALVGLFFFVMLMSIKELSASILLYTQRGPVLSVLTWSYMEAGNFQFAAAVGVMQSLIMLALVIVTRMAFGIKIERAASRH